jgi:Tfp pilus assembly protein PilO
MNDIINIKLNNISENPMIASMVLMIWIAKAVKTTSRETK